MTERKDGTRRMPRGLAIVFCYILFIAAVVGFMFLLVPRLSRDVARLGKEAPALYKKANDQYVPELARWIDPRDVEARQRLAALTLEPGDPPIVAGEDLGQTARPRAVERVLERARERRPDLGGRGARGDLVRVEERDRRRIAGQAASTTTVAP